MTTGASALKREARSFDSPDLQKRYEKTLRFVLDYGLRRSLRPVLDIGAENDFGKALSAFLSYDYNFTLGDLDEYEGWAPSNFGSNWKPYQTVTCFEVLEHLMNPALFLENLKYYVCDEVLLVVSVPRRLHPFFWSRTHFHEFDELRIRYLFEATGWKVRVHGKYIQWPVFSEFFKGKKIGRFWIPGIRPMLRLFTGYFLLGLTRRHFYTLTLKKEVQ